MRHFEVKYYEKDKNSKHYGLTLNMKPVPTTFDPKTVINKALEIINVTSAVSIPWRSPKVQKILKRWKLRK